MSLGELGLLILLRSQLVLIRLLEIQIWDDLAVFGTCASICSCLGLLLVIDDALQGDDRVDLMGHYHLQIVGWLRLDNSLRLWIDWASGTLDLSLLQFLIDLVFVF